MDSSGTALTAHDVFSRIRLEHEQQPLFFLPPIMEELEEPRPRYLVGTRGTGKTTLLKAMNWRERLHNPSLRSQLGDDPFHARYLGLYLKLPEVQLGSVDRWLADTDESTMAGIFATYLDSAWLQLAARAVSELTADSIFETDPRDEWRLLEDAVEQLRDYAAFADTPTQTTLSDLRRQLNKIQRYVEQAARKRLDPHDVADALPMDVGALGRLLGAVIVELCQRYRPTPDAEPVDAAWRLHVCLDEAESLSLRQLITLNTMVRLSTAPTYMLASFVGQPKDTESTYAPGLTLADADVGTTNRDRIPQEEFVDLVQGVVQARSHAVLGEQGPTVDLKQLLGDPDLNDLIALSIGGSESEKTRELVTDARQWARVVGRPVNPDDAEVGQLPLWQAYAVRRRRGEIPQLPPEEVRHFESTYVRKVRAAAYLSWHRERRIRPLYAGCAIFTDLADSCVRDFLWQMDALLHAATNSVTNPASALTTLLSARVDYKKQSTALYAASNDKLERISRSLTTAPEPGRQLIIRLGETLQQLELHRLKRPLDAEPGLFEFKLTDGDENDQSAAKLIRDSAEAGYLKLDQMTPAVWRFRLHRSLAPKFRLSWRAGYRNMRLSGAQILAMAHTGAEARTAEAQRARVTLIENQLDGQAELVLPFGTEE